MPSNSHDNISSPSIFSISFHRQQQALSSTAGHITHAVLITIEQRYGHFDNLILNDPQAVKNNRVQCIRMYIFYKTLLS